MKLTKKAGYLFCCTLFFIVLPAIAYGHDLIQPDWRGQEGTTYQQWTFEDDNNPASPEVINNDYGTASAAVTLGPYNSGWLYQLPGMGTQTGYWDIGAEGGRIIVEIDNQSGGTLQKEIWIQVTYFKDIHQAPIVSVPGAAYLSGQTIQVEDAGYGAEWLLDQSIWQLEPGPSHEQVIIASNASGSIVDQIVVDTRSSGCLVAFDDLSNFCAQWLEEGTNLEANLDGVGNVNFHDFAIFASFWMKACPPDWPWP